MPSGHRLVTACCLYCWPENPVTLTFPLVAIVLPSIERKAWHQVSDDVDDLLTGKKLLPEIVKPGLDVQKLLLDPPPLSVLSGAEDKWQEPYRREGELLNARRMRAVECIFQGNFFYFAPWFN